MAYELIYDPPQTNVHVWELKHNWPSNHVLTKIYLDLTYDMGTNGYPRAEFGYLDGSTFVELHRTVGPYSSRRGNLDIEISAAINSSHLPIINSLISSGEVTRIKISSSAGGFIAAPSIVSHEFSPYGSINWETWYVLENGVEVPLTLDGVRETLPAATTQVMEDLQPMSLIDLTQESIVIHGAGQVTEDTSTYTGSSRKYNGSKTTIAGVAGDSTDPRTYIVWMKAPYEQEQYVTVMCGFSGANRAQMALQFATHGPTTYADKIYLHGGSDLTNQDLRPQLFNDKWNMIAFSSSTLSDTQFVLNNAPASAHVYANRTQQAMEGIDIGFDRTNTPNRHLNGEIAAIAVYDRVLTQAEIQSIYAAGKPGPETKVVLPLSFSVYEAPKNRYWDYEPIHAIVDAEGSIGGSAEGQAFYTAYGMDGISYSNGGDFLGGRISEPVIPHSPLYKRAMKSLFEQLSKYPPEFIEASMFVRATFVQNITGSIEGRDYGGVAQSDRFWFDIAGFPTYNDTYWGTPDDGVELIIHHELHHVLKSSWASDFTAMEAEWNSHNSLPYIGSDYFQLDPNVRPPGHFRMYGRLNYTEDLADTLAFMMTTSLQPVYQQIIAEDPAVAAKVKMMKKWLASKNTMFADENYYIAIHSN